MSLTYYLTIDGIVGDATVDGHQGSFAISDYRFDVSGLMSAVAGAGSGGGTPTFSPLMVDLNSRLTALLKEVASGRHIKSIELKGVTSDGQTLCDLRHTGIGVQM